MNRLDSGTISEFKTMIKLTEIGYCVFRPFGSHSVVDILFQIDATKYMKIQVKTIGAIGPQIGLRCSRGANDHKYSENDVDFFIVVDGCDFHIVPFSSTNNQVFLTLKHNFLNRWDLLPPPYEPNLPSQKDEAAPIRLRSI